MGDLGLGDFLEKRDVVLGVEKEYNSVSYLY
jgi:hypothetical protein